LANFHSIHDSFGRFYEFTLDQEMVTAQNWEATLASARKTKITLQLSRKRRPDLTDMVKWWPDDVDDDSRTTSRRKTSTNGDEEDENMGEPKEQDMSNADAVGRKERLKPTKDRLNQDIQEMRQMIKQLNIRPAEAASSRVYENDSLLHSLVEKRLVRLEAEERDAQRDLDTMKPSKRSSSSDASIAPSVPSEDERGRDGVTSPKKKESPTQSRSPSRESRKRSRKEDFCILGSLALESSSSTRNESGLGNRHLRTSASGLIDEQKLHSHLLETHKFLWDNKKSKERQAYRRTDETTLDYLLAYVEGLQPKGPGTKAAKASELLDAAKDVFAFFAPLTVTGSCVGRFWGAMNSLLRVCGPYSALLYEDSAD